MPHTRHPSSQRDPRVRSLLKLSTSSASWPRSLSGIYIYTHTSSVPSPSFSRLLSVRCLSLSISFPGLPITFLPRASSTSRGQLPRTLYFLLPVPCGDFLQRFPPFHSATYIPITMMLFRSEDRLVSIIIYGGWRYIWMEVDWDT